MPLMDTYGPDMMKQEARTEFVNWYHNQVTAHVVIVKKLCDTAGQMLIF